MAFWAGFENSHGLKYVGDCLDVLMCFKSGMSSWLNGSSPHADFCKSVLLRVGEGRWKSSITDVEKVKAHLTLDDTILQGGSSRKFYGNSLADEFAKRGAAMHPSSELDLSEYKQAKIDVTNLAVHVIDCLSSLGLDRFARTGRLTRLPRGFRFPRVSSKAGPTHNFLWNGKLWYCTFCFLKTRNPSVLAPSKAFCEGVSFFDSIILEPLGHELWGTRVSEGRPMIYCSLCWHYALSYPRKLDLTCRRGDSTIKPSEKFYLMRVQLPTSKEVFAKPIRLHSPLTARHS